MNLRPRSDLIYVEPFERLRETVGGIILPPETDDKEGKETMVRGKVVKAGPKCGTIQEGDEVLHTKWTGTEFKFDDNNYVVMHETDVMAVVNA